MSYSGSGHNYLYIHDMNIFIETNLEACPVQILLVLPAGQQVLTTFNPVCV